MAKIEAPILQIPDERLKKAIGAAVKAIKKTKKFGLVFEDHLPETVRLAAQRILRYHAAASKIAHGH